MSKEIVVAACHNRPPSDSWDLSDLKLYHALRLLYAEFFHGVVSKEQAQKEKIQLLKAWEKEKYCGKS